MKTSQKGISLIEQFEGLKTTVYLDSAGIWTIGIGHTGPNINKNTQPITEAQAIQYLQQDLAVAENAINKYVKVPLTQNNFDALVSFVYNCGSGNFASSTLLKKINMGDFVGASKEFGRWNKASGQVISGLTRRRTEEANLFMSS